MASFFLINLIALVFGIVEASDSIKLKNIMFIALYIIVITLFLHVNYLLILIIDIILGIILFCRKTIKGKYKGIKKEYYDTLINNYRNESLLVDYKRKVHENNNHMLIIKGMLGEKDTLCEYVDSLIDDKLNLDSALVTELCYINDIGIKNFLSSKLSKILSLNAKLELHISEEIKNVQYVNNVKELNNLYTILGVLLDNIIDSVKVSKTKLVSIIAYVSKDKVYFELANTYNSKIDLEKLGNGKYSTKGSNHGVGLSLVKKIVKSSEIYNLETFILDNFFVQKLEIKIKK